MAAKALFLTLALALLHVIIGEALYDGLAGTVARYVRIVGG